MKRETAHSYQNGKTHVVNPQNVAALQEPHTDSTP